MEQPVTAKVKLPHRQELQDTIEVYADALQFCIDTAWEHDIIVRKELHDKCYYPVREQYDVPAQLTCNILQHAIEAVKESDSKPDVGTEHTPRYNFPRSASVNSDWTELSLLTLDGRINLDITVPDCYQQYLDLEVRESTLMEKNGEFYFCFVFVKEVEIPAPSCRDGLEVLGVDLGVNKVAVTSDGNFYGTEIKEKRRQRDEFVAEIQSKGTHAAHNRVKEYGSRWKRFMDWKNHNIARQIVDKLENGDVIVLEDLTDIRNDNENTWVHKWAFRDLADKIEYKAHLNGIKVVYTDPHNTSQHCSACHSLDTDRTGENDGWFTCNHCGYTLDADLNAAKNIAHSYMETLEQAGTSKRANDSGTDDAEATRPSDADNTRKPLPHEAKASA
jgi:IS605 OrfB family transposase